MNLFNLYALPKIWYVGLYLFSIITILITGVYWPLKIFLTMVVTFCLIYSSCCQHNKKFNNFYHLSTTPDYWLLDDGKKKYLAQLDTIAYQSKYLICLHWHLIPKVNIIKTILCCWHYQPEQWRSLHVLLRIHSPFRTHEK